MSTPTHSVSVAGAIYDESADSFLVIQRRDNGEWQLPGGVLELDETIEEGVIREVLEETGVVVKPVKLTGVYKNMIRKIVSLVFLCEVVSGDLQINDEAQKVEWMAAVRVPEMMSEAFAVRLLDAISDNTPVIRTNDGTNLI